MAKLKRGRACRAIQLGELLTAFQTCVLLALLALRN
jgi:hypothetical protein